MTHRDRVGGSSGRRKVAGDAVHRQNFSTPSDGSLFPSPRGSRGRPLHTVSGGHPPVGPRGRDPSDARDAPFFIYSYFAVMGKGGGGQETAGTDPVRALAPRPAGRDMETRDPRWRIWL